METEITNLYELDARIAILKIKKVEDEIYFNQRYLAVKNKITHPFRFIKNLFLGGEKASGHFKADWVTTFGRIFLPLFLNKTLLRNRGVLIKTIASLFSQKIVSSDVLNKDILSNWIDNVTSFVRSKTKKDKRYGTDDYGIPPESETA